MPTRSPSSKSCKHNAIALSGPLIVGVDVHKRSYAVSLWSRNADKEISRWSQPADPAALGRRLLPLAGQIERIAYEAGPAGFVLARHLSSAGFNVIVSSPGDIPVGRNESKSDKRDSQRLGRLAARDMLPSCHIPTEQQEYERRVVRTRGKILADKTRLQIRIKSLLLNHGIAEPAGRWGRTYIKSLREARCPLDIRFCLDTLLNSLEHTDTQLTHCNRQVAEIALRPHNASTIALLCSVPGIGQLSAMQYHTEMTSSSRFASRIQVSKYQGLSPETRSSGESRHQLGLGCSGNRRLRAMLIEAAWRWISYDEVAKRLYGHYMHNTGCAQKAITAVARKLGIVLWAISESGEVYDSTKLGRKFSTPKP